MKIKFIIILFFLFSSCSDYLEKEEILDYQEYLYQGWVAFETVNIENKFSKDSSNSYYYELAIDMFEVSELAINYEFLSQNLLGPHYKSYTGLGWSELYYSSEFLNQEDHYKRDSLRLESKSHFDKALINLDSQIESTNILSQDKCDLYSGLSYVHYYNGLDQFEFDSSLFFSNLLINECPEYVFSHDEFDIRNMHYLRGKIFLYQDFYSEACIEMSNANNCSCDYNNVDINVLLDCFEEFSSGN